MEPDTPAMLGFQVAPVDLGKNSFFPGQGEKYLTKVVSGDWTEYAG
jgi:hypothetical protein